MTQLMTLEEMAKYFRVNKITIRRMAWRHEIPANKFGGQWRFNKALVDTWLRQSSERISANILVIDDDETICSLFEDNLQEGGYAVTTVSESLEGLELVKNRDYDLVFLDLKMPIMDGAELFRQIRIFKPELPVTIITGYPDSDLMMSALAYGPLGVIRKPFTGSDILTAVNTYLRFGMSIRCL